MGFWDKVGFHVASTYLHGQAKGLAIGREAGESVSDSDVAKIVGGVIGFVGGSIVGGISMWSPIGMLKTAMLSDEEMDRRGEDMDKTIKDAYGK